MGIFSKEEVKKDLPMPADVVIIPPYDPEPVLNKTPELSYRQKFANVSSEHMRAVELEERMDAEVKACQKEVDSAKKNYEQASFARSEAAKARRETGDKLAALLGYKKGY